jgi:hypothetical protein
MFRNTYYIATTCTSTVDHLIDRGNLSESGGRVYEALLPKFDSVLNIFIAYFLY